MTPRAFRVLGFPAVLERLAALCVSPLGRERALALEPSPWLDEAARRQQLTTEARALGDGAGGLPVRGIRDVREPVHRAAIGGSLGALELLEIRDTLGVGRALKGFLTAHAADAPGLAEQAGGLTIFTELESSIGTAIADDGSITDQASPELAKIRRERYLADARLRQQLDHVLRTPAVQRMLREPLITIRGDRYVVPVRSEFREQFPGIAHDQSASGVTVFMEPLTIVPLGNRVRELAAAEDVEIARILAALSASVGAASEPIGDTLDALGALDLAAASAALSQRMNASPPRLNAAGHVDLRGARHPLLTGTVVPIDLRLGRDFRTLVITGPNTGGKTVTLRTLGLLTLMAQAGLHVPAAPESEVAVFAGVFADIGDEQSIEQNLSTFSSHLTAIVEILRLLATIPREPGTALVLLDEVGAGTDPVEGTALARALIEILHERGVCTAVTTHYSELKALAFTHAGIENASVEFDEETLRPTYRLLIGTPGRSNALAIASRLGLDPAIVERARGYLSQEQEDLSRVIQRVEEERVALGAERDAAGRDRLEIARLRADLEDERRRAAEERRRSLARTRDELDAVIRAGRRELGVLTEALRAERSPQAAARLRAHLRALGRAAETYAEAAPAPPGAPVDSVRPGDRVLVASLGRPGIVQAEADARGEVEVQVGAVKVRVPLDDLRQEGTAAGPDDGTSPYGRGEADAAGRRPVEGAGLGAAAVPASIHLRGMTVDEATLALDKYLDEAALAGLPFVTVIHGKGTGTLRRALHDFLAHHPHATSFRLGGEGEGGSGATIVRLGER
ncbi:MAG TPA: endonuclease MutS2 [bacterium]|nr:endonuclease MutS2 [bacterium]